MTLGWPEIVVLLWMTLGVGGHLAVALAASVGATFPTPRPKRVSERWGGFIGRVAHVALVAWLLNAGGFW